MIPKIIHYCWFGGNPKPKLAKKCIRSWKKYCKDYQIIEWNESNIDFSAFPSYVREAYEAKVWGFVPDYIRLWLVYTYGGIYLDTDVEIIRPIDSLLENEAFAGFETPSDVVALGLGFGAEPGNFVLKKLMDSYENLHFVNQDGTLNKIPAPTLNAAVFRELGLKEDDTNQAVGNMTIYSSEYFCPLTFSTREINKTENTYTIHWFTASWFDEKKKLEYKHQIKKYKKDKRYYKRKNFIDWLKHTPNRILIKILGKNNYEKLKNKLKG